MVKFALFLVSLFKKPIQLLGVDYPQFEILLSTKLTIDFRNGSSTFQTPGSKKRTFLTQLFIFALYGFLLGVVSFAIGDLLLNLTIFFSIIMVTLSMTLISEFTTVLFDHRDNNILLPRPVSNRTLLLLRLVHIQFYMGYIAFSLSLGPGIILAFKYKLIAVLIYFIAVGLCTWLTLVFTTFVYLLISKTVEGERFKDILSYIQIVVAVLIIAGYQLVPKLIDETVLSNASMTIHWWAYLYPPAWLGALVKMSLFSGITTPVLVLSGLALVIPVTGAILLIRLLSKGFENILGEGSSGNAAPVIHRTEGERGAGIFKKIFCNSGIERAGWDLAVATTKRDRKFKQTVYPYFGMMLVFAILTFKPDLDNLAVSLQEKSEFTKYLFIIIIGYAGTMAVFQLPYTDTPEATWIYQALPIKDSSHLLTGAVKAMLIRFFLPVYLLITIISVWLWGPGIIPQIVLSCLGILSFTLLTIFLQRMGLPFTQVREMQQKGNNTITVIISMIMMVILAFAVYGTTLISVWATLFLILITGVFNLYLFKNLRRRKI